MTPTSPDSHPKSRRRRWVLGGLLLLALAAAGGWWWQHRDAPLDPPAVPTDIGDPAVREAIEADRRRVLAEPRSAAAWGSLGMSLLAYLYYEPADRCFAEAARLDPANARWPYYRHSVAAWIDPPRALPFLKQAAEIGSSIPQEQTALRLQLADRLLEEQHTDEADRLYGEVLRAQPKQPRAIFGRGLAALARGDSEDAATFLKAAQANSSTRNRATVQLAILAERTHNPAEAAALRTQAAALPADPDWPDPFMQAVFEKRVGLAQEMQDVAKLEREGRGEEAAELSLRRIEREPHNPRHYVAAALSFARSGDFDRAMPLMHQAIAKAPGDAGPLYTLAQLLFRRAELEAKRSPGSEKSRQWYREAAGSAEKACALKRDYAEAYLLQGRALLLLGEPERAIAPLQAGATCRPESFELQLALGIALLDAGRQKEAAGPLANARELSPRDARLAEALKRLAKP